MQQENRYQVFTYSKANGLEIIISNIAKEKLAWQCKGRHG
jgi:hypothetical protein